MKDWPQELLIALSGASEYKREGVLSGNEGLQKENIWELSIRKRSYANYLAYGAVPMLDSLP